jgi:hypothetical protein
MVFTSPFEESINTMSVGVVAISKGLLFYDYSKEEALT